MVLVVHRGSIGRGWGGRSKNAEKFWAYIYGLLDNVKPVKTNKLADKSFVFILFEFKGADDLQYFVK